MYRLRFTQILFISLLFVLSGCLSQADALPPITKQFNQQRVADADQWRTHEDAEGRYQIAYPHDWVLTPSTTGADTVHILRVTTTANTPQASVTITARSATLNLKRVTEETRKALQGQTGVTNLTLTAEEGVAVNGLRGIEQIFEYTIEETTLTSHMIYLRHPDYLFALTLTTPDASATEFVPLFESMVRTFTIPEDSPAQ